MRRYNLNYSSIQIFNAFGSNIFVFFYEKLYYIRICIILYYIRKFTNNILIRCRIHVANITQIKYARFIIFTSYMVVCNLIGRKGIEISVTVQCTVCIVQLYIVLFTLYNCTRVSTKWLNFLRKICAIFAHIFFVANFCALFANETQ